MAASVAQQQQPFTPLPLPPPAQGGLDPARFSSQDMARYLSTMNAATPGQQHSPLFSPQQQQQQTSSSTQPPSSSVQLSGSGVSSAAAGSAHQADAAPKESSRARKAATANGPAGKRARGTKGRNQTDTVDLHQLVDEAEGNTKKRAAEWSVDETV